MAHQSLYRRYRPRRFADVRGQEHVIKALRNAVAQGTEGHAYLFSGPRGTGKTSTARILAKALNCPDLSDGEPCGVCDSCRSIEQGSSYDLFELDAASNNGVDAMRDLISRTVVGSPGRTKVYILDEVHMLSPAASNALLKTLEEPPEHVCFVLATTDPQKVLPTIRSRTQHFEFSLLSAAELTEYVHWIRSDAGLAVDDAALDHVVRQGRGSARDTLSALDMVVAAGGVSERPESIDEILAALTERDTARVMVAVSDATAQGREPRVLAEQLLVSLRDAFLASVQAPLEHLSDADQARIAELAGALGTPTITRALESLGAAVVDMRQAADPRVPLEVALIKLTTPAAAADVATLLERIEDLERRVARLAANGGGGGGNAGGPASGRAAAPAAPAPSAPAAPARAGAPDRPSAPARPGAGSGPAQVRAELANRRTDGPPPRPSSAPTPPPVAAPEPAPAPVAEAESSPAPASAPSRARPTLDQLATAMTESVLPTLAGMARSLYGAGRFVDEVDGAFRFALDHVPDRVLPRAQAVVADVEAALSARVGQPVSIVLLNGAPDGAAPAGSSGSSASRSPGAAPRPEARSDRPAPAPGTADGPAADPATGSPGPAGDDVDDEDPHLDVSELEDAHDVSTTGVDKLLEAFPGTELIEQEQ